MTNRPIKIGVTGGIGAGKTLVTKLFSFFGIPVYDADSRARWILNNHADVKRDIVAEFGENAYFNAGFNSRFIADQVFKNNAKVLKLNEIVHPRVGEDFNHWVVKNSQAPYLIKEAALLFEAGSFLVLDKIIVVAAPKSIRLKRIQARDPLRTEAEILSIMDKQMPEEEKVKRADFVLHNDESQLLIPQVFALHNRFLNSISDGI